MPFKVIQGHQYWCQSKFEGGLTIVHEAEDCMVEFCGDSRNNNNNASR